MYCYKNIISNQEMATKTKIYLISLTLSFIFVIVNCVDVNPINFLNVDLNQGTWLSKAELRRLYEPNLVEGGWVNTQPGHFVATHICRAKIGNSNNNGAVVVPGELLNGTCYLSSNPDSSPPGSIYGVRQISEDWSALLKQDDEVYEWITFKPQDGGGQIPSGAVIGGIRQDFEPLLICRKVFKGTEGDVGGPKAVPGNFSPKDGKCYYELEFGSTTTTGLKFDLSFTSEHFQILVLRARGKPTCSEP